MAAFTTNGGGKSSTRQRYKPMAEINVTPFVDVMLVLLVVFMITAPLLTIGVPVDLPKTQADTLEGSEEPLTITIDSDGKIFLQEAEVVLEDLAPRLIAVAEARGGNQGRIFVRGDRNIDYGAVMRVMGTINAAGFKRVALVTERLPEQVAN